MRCIVCEQDMERAQRGLVMSAMIYVDEREATEPVDVAVCEECCAIGTGSLLLRDAEIVAKQDAS